MQPGIAAYSQAWVLLVSSEIHEHRREEQLALDHAEASIALATDQGFPPVLAMGTIMRGWALAQQGQEEEGIGQVRGGITAWRTMGVELQRPHSFALLAEMYRKMGRIEEGLSVLAEALAIANKNGERGWEAELYRLKGELTLQSKASLGQVEDKSQTSQSPLAVEQEAEGCFLKAIEIAQGQQAKSWELRAATSLARLWHQQALPPGAGSLEQGVRNTQHATRTKLAEAHKLLSEIYNWFTEGFDTKDLQEAKALLESLSQ